MSDDLYSLWRTGIPAADLAELTRSDAELLSTVDVVVVGGGLIGLATGFSLAEQGLSVQLLSAGALAGDCSSVNFGGVWPNETGAAYTSGYQELAFRSRDLWGRLAVRPEFTLDWRVNGFLQLNPQRLAPGAEAFAEAQLEAGYSLTAVDAEQIASLEPALSTGWKEGVHYPSDAQLNPVRAAIGFAKGIRRKGGRIALHSPARLIEPAGTGPVIVSTPTGTVQALRLIAATGFELSWLGSLKPQIPLEAVSGQILATEPQPPLLKSTVAAEYLVCQLKSGEILTGGNQVPGVVRTLDEDEARKMQAAARTLLPALVDVPFTRSVVGVRSRTPDGLPVIDHLPEQPAIWLACGHHRAGVLLATGTAELLTEKIRGRTTTVDAMPFRLNRWA